MESVAVIVWLGLQHMVANLNLNAVSANSCVWKDCFLSEWKKTEWFVKVKKEELEIDGTLLTVRTDKMLLTHSAAMTPEIVTTTHRPNRNFLESVWQLRKSKNIYMYMYVCMCV